MTIDLALLLKIAGAGQLSVALLNFSLVRLLRWRDDLQKLPLLIREVFQVHLWFISVTLLIFGVLSWNFSSQMASGTNDLAAWLCGAIGIFWALRTILQVAYYSSSHWRGRRDRFAIHVCLLLVYGGLSATYLTAAARYI
jgi:hypothetical protein